MEQGYSIAGDDDGMKFGKELLAALKLLGSGAASMSTFAFTYVPAIAQGESVTRDTRVVEMVQNAIKKIRQRC